MTSPDPPIEAPPPTLAQTAARGAVVVLGGQGGRIVIQLASVIVLARFLSPSDFGFLAMVMAIIGIGEVFRDFGLSAAAIQAREVSRPARDNLFWINSGIGLLLGLLAFVGAGLISAFYDQPEVVAITQALSLTFVLNGLATQYRADLVRRFRFAALAGTDVVAQALGLAGGILMAINGHGYWALVAQQLIQAGAALVFVVVSGRWLPGRPRRGVDMSEFTRFAWNLTGAQVVGYLSNNVDSMVIGARFGAAPLGLYNRAYQLLMTTLSQLRGPSTTVALPVLSRLRDDPDRFDAYLLRAQIALGYTLVVGLGIAAGAAGPIVEVALGQRWLPVVPIFVFLAIAGIFQTLSYVGYWVYLSRNLTGDLFRYTLLTSAIKVTCVLVGSLWGVLGVAVGFAVAPMLAWPLSLWWLSRRTSFPAKGLSLGALRILGVTALVGGVTALAVQFLPLENPPVLLLAGTACGLAALALGAALLPPVQRDVLGVVDILRSVRRR